MTFDELQTKLGPQDGKDWGIHPNGGGWVQKSCYVVAQVLVDDKSIVAGECRVLGDVKIINSTISGKVKVGSTLGSSIGIFGSSISDRATVMGNCTIQLSKIYDNAKVFGKAVIDESVIHGRAYVCGNSQVVDHSNVYDNARVYGRGFVGHRSTVCGNARVYGCGRVSGDSWVDGNARVSGHSDVNESKIGGYVRVYGNAYLDLVKVNKKERYHELVMLDF